MMHDTDTQEYQRYVRMHETYLKQARELEGRMESLAPYELGKLEYVYTKLERAAWHIAGWYKKKAKYHEGMAEIVKDKNINDCAKKKARHPQTRNIRAGSRRASN